MWLTKYFGMDWIFLQVWAHQTRRCKRRDSGMLGEHITLLCKFIPVPDPGCCLLERKASSQTFLHKLWVILCIFVTLLDITIDLMLDIAHHLGFVCCIKWHFRNLFINYKNILGIFVIVVDLLGHYCIRHCVL